MAANKSKTTREYPVGFELSDEQWVVIADLFPEYVPSEKGGRPPVPPRPCLEGIIWILRTGAQWEELPDRFPSPTTCWRRLHEWQSSGVLREAWSELAWDLHRDGALDWSEGAGDATFVSAVKGGTRWASLKSAKAPRSKSSAKVGACPSA